MDPARQFLVDLKNLSDEAVLPVGGVRAGVLEQFERAGEASDSCRMPETWQEQVSATPQVSAACWGTVTGR